MAPNAYKNDFYELVSEHTNECSDEVRFLLVMEIKRLAQPCVKSIDLRLLVEQPCEIRMLEGVKHHLSEEGLELYQHLYSQYQSYTVGVREGVISYFRKQRDVALDADEDSSNKPSNTDQQKAYISPVNELLEYPCRNEERLKIEHDVRLFFSATVLIKGKTKNISRQGICLQLYDETEITLVKGYRPIQLVFVDLDINLKLDKVPIKFLVNGVSKDSASSLVHLSRNWSDGPNAYNRYVEDLFKNKKYKDAIDTKNTEIAIESKIYEQAFSATCPDLSLFINTQDQLQPFVEFACFNQFNATIVDYWQDEKNNQTLGYVFGVQRLRKLLIESDTDVTTIMYCFSYTKNDKVYFYSVFEKELAQNPTLKDVFLSYGARKASWRVYKLCCHQIDSTQAHLRTSLPNGINYVITKANSDLSPKLSAKLKPLTHMLTMSDITHYSGQQSYYQRNLEKDKIKLLSVYGHAKNRQPHSIETLKFAWFDKRVESRYKLRTKVELLCNQRELVGTTEDFSTEGLRLELDAQIDSQVGGLINVSFPILQEKSASYDLIAIPYKLIRKSDDGFILHLKIQEGDAAKSVKQFFRMLINKNKERLEVLTGENASAGLREALRVLQAKFSPQMCISVNQQKDLYYPTKTAVNLSRSRGLNHFKHQMPAKFLNVSSLFKINEGNIQHIGNALNESRKLKLPVSHEVYTCFDESQIEHNDAVQSFWEHDLKSHVGKYNFIQNALKTKAFSACRVTCVTKQTPITQLYDEELKYLRKYNPKEAKKLESIAYNFSGHVFVTDITQEVLLRYRLFAS